MKIIKFEFTTNNSGYRWTDLYSESISGILLEHENAWYYKENQGAGRFSVAQLVAEKPSLNGLSAGVVHILDTDNSTHIHPYLVSESSHQV